MWHVYTFQAAPLFRGGRSLRAMGLPQTKPARFLIKSKGRTDSAHIFRAPSLRTSKSPWAAPQIQARITSEQFFLFFKTWKAGPPGPILQPPLTFPAISDMPPVYKTGNKGTSCVSEEPSEGLHFILALPKALRSKGPFNWFHLITISMRYPRAC